MNPLHELLSSERNQHAEHDNPNLTGQPAPTMQRASADEMDRETPGDDGEQCLPGAMGGERTLAVPRKPLRTGTSGISVRLKA
jgi:hypothetical protein